MSKILAPKSYVFAATVLILQFFTFAGAQDVEISVKIKPQSAEIKGKVFKGEMPPTIWFLDAYGEIDGLHDRLSVVYFYDKQGFLIARRRLTSSDTIKTANIGGFAYSIDLKPRQSPFAAAHMSWLTDSRGILMLDDLLPQMKGKSAKIAIEVPLGWKVVTSETELSPNVFTVQNLEKSVFYLGKDLRIIKTQAATLVNTGGDWHFKDSEAAAMLSAIASDYEKVFGPLKSNNNIVRITEFPTEQIMGSWEADTRGQSVTIVSADMPFRNMSLQRLHEQLRHELFHLWVPNGVNLTGNYDWFYEGFALYQSLKTGVASNQLRFEDYLNSISQAYAIDSAAAKRISLIDASKERWAGQNNTNVYARGMLAAFACDLAMLRVSGGKQNVTNLIAAIIRRHSHPAAQADANTAIIAELRSRPELIPIVDKMIAGDQPFEFPELLNAAGLEVENDGPQKTIKTVAKPNGKQKDFLKRLGSENWRKISSN